MFDTSRQVGTILSFKSSRSLEFVEVHVAFCGIGGQCSQYGVVSTANLVIVMLKSDLKERSH